MNQVRAIRKVIYTFNDVLYENAEKINVLLAEQK